MEEDISDHQGTFLCKNLTKISWFFIVPKIHIVCHPQKVAIKLLEVALLLLWLDQPREGPETPKGQTLLQKRPKSSSTVWFTYELSRFYVFV